MKINDLNGLLQEKSVEQQMDLVLEDLEIAATADRDPKEMTPDKDNKDSFPADEHKEAEDVEGVVVKEESQVAAGPELEKATELKNEATLEKSPDEMSSEIDNKDVYPTDEHSQKEEVKEVVVEGCAKKTSLKNTKVLKEKTEYSDFDLMRILDENGYEASLDNLLILKEQLAEGSIVIEDALESDPVVTDTKEKIEDTDKEAETGDLSKADDAEKKDEDAGEAKAEEDKKEETDDKVEELVSDKADEDAKEDDDSDEDEEELSEGMRSLFSLIDSINESVSQTAAGPELGSAAELKNEATEEGKPSEMSSEKDNKDVYPVEDHSQAEDVEGVVVKESEQLAAGPELGSAAELKNEATEEGKPSEMSSEKDNKDVYPADEHKQEEDVEGVVVKEESQVAAGPELEKAAELDNEATVEKEPSVAAPSTDNKDIYPANIHKQVEDVVEVVVEAAAVCKAKGIKATRENLIHECQALMEEKAANVEDPTKKEFDVDEFINSKEMTGTKATEGCNDNPTPSELGGESGSKCASELTATDLKESVRYNSIKEACLLDEGYFQTDSYTIQTGAEKQQKLVEQISLLLARENMDPMYDELLTEAIHAQRLNEAIVRKYSARASVRARNIYEK